MKNRITVNARLSRGEGTQDESQRRPKVNDTDNACVLSVIRSGKTGFAEGFRWCPGEP